MKLINAIYNIFADKTPLEETEEYIMLGLIDILSNDISDIESIDVLINDIYDIEDDVMCSRYTTDVTRALFRMSFKIRHRLMNKLDK